MARRRRKQYGCLTELFLMPVKFIYYICIYLPLKGLEAIIDGFIIGITNGVKLSKKQKKHYYLPRGLEVDMAFVDAMDGHDFEYLFADILKGLGYKDVSVTPGSGDRGADVIAFTYKGKQRIKTTFQCKRYSYPVGNAAVQEVYAAKGIYNADEAIVVTTNSFTRQAVDDAKKLGVKLWDRSMFITMFDLYKQKTRM